MSEFWPMWSTKVDHCATGGGVSIVRLAQRTIKPPLVSGRVSGWLGGWVGDGSGCESVISIGVPAYECSFNTETWWKLSRPNTYAVAILPMCHFAIFFFCQVREKLLSEPPFCFNWENQPLNKNKHHLGLRGLTSWFWTAAIEQFEMPSDDDFKSAQ